MLGVPTGLAYWKQ